MRKVTAGNIVTGDVLRLRDPLSDHLDDVEVISKRVAGETIHLTVDDGRTLQFGYDYSLNVVNDKASMFASLTDDELTTLYRKVRHSRDILWTHHGRGFGGSAYEGMGDMLAIMHELHELNQNR